MPRERIYCLTKDDFVLQTYKGSGAGGQHRNKRETGVRIIHPDSGAAAQSCEHKSQLQNRKEAFRKLIKHPKFRMWHNIKVMEYDQGRSIENEVEEMMQSKYLQIEVKDEFGRWVIQDEEPDKSS
jgi:peptide chain release factor 1